MPYNGASSAIGRTTRSGGVDGLAEAAEKYKNWGRWWPSDEIGGSPQQFTEYVRAEVAKWAVVVKQAGAKLE